MLQRELEELDKEQKLKAIEEQKRADFAAAAQDGKPGDLRSPCRTL